MFTSCSVSQGGITFVHMRLICSVGIEWTVWVSSLLALQWRLLHEANHLSVPWEGGGAHGSTHWSLRTMW